MRLEKYFEIVTNYLNEILILHPNDIILIGGDFNCRIAACNQLPIDIPIDSYNFSLSRSTLDDYKCARGELLTNCMEKNNYVVLNRRSKRDSPAYFAYIGSKGLSVIDLIWCSASLLDEVDDFCVCDLASRSDHLPRYLLVCAQT